MDNFVNPQNNKYNSESYSDVTEGQGSTNNQDYYQQTDPNYAPPVFYQDSAPIQPNQNNPQLQQSYYSNQNYQYQAAPPTFTHNSNNLTQNSNTNVNLFEANYAYNIYTQSSVENESRSNLECSLNVLPSKKSACDKIRLPIGLICSPFITEEGVVSTYAPYVIRCGNCYSYLNRYAKVVTRNSYICSVCSHQNSVSDAALTDSETSKILPLNARREFECACIEFDAPTSQTKESPMPLSLVFLLDISNFKLSSLYIDVVAKAIKDNLDKISADKRSSITILTFDSFIYTYKISTASSGYQIQQNVVTDLDDPFNPDHDGCCIRFKSDDKLAFLLDRLPELVKAKSHEEAGCCFTSAVNYAVKLLTKFGGGRITAFTTNPPTMGLGVYTPRVPPPITTGNEKESAHFLPSYDYYRVMAMDCLEKKVTVDLFCLSNTHLDLSTIAPLCQLTGGEIYMSPQSEEFSYQNREWLSRNLGIYLQKELKLDTIIRLRANSNVEVQTYFGHCFVSSAQKLSIPVANPNSTIAFQLHISDDLQNSNERACFQLSILYTQPNGNRKLRTLTLAIPLSDSFETIYSNINVPCLVGLLSRMAVERVMQSSIADTREATLNALLDMCTSYKDFQGNRQHYNNLPVPFSIYQTSVYVHALLNCESLQLSKSTTHFDRRFGQLLIFRCWPVEYLTSLLFPVLYSLIDLLPYMELNDPFFIINYKMYSVPSTYQYIYPGNIYILDTAVEIFIYISPKTSAGMIHDLFNATDYESMPDLMLSIPILDNKLNKFLHSFINLITANRPTFPNVTIFKDSFFLAKQKFTSMLLFDKTDKSESYAEFIQKIRNKILVVN